MANFTATHGDTAITELTIPTNHSTRLRLAGVKRRVSTDIKISSSNSAVATASIRSSPYDGPKGIWTVDLKSQQKGKAKITAKHTSGQTVVQATLDVDVIVQTKLELPASTLPSGLFVRLFLAESINPGNAVYKKATVKTGMQWMQVVVYNRLNHSDPGRFSAKQGKNKKWDIFDIVRAPRQFDGFDKYPTLSDSVNKRIEAILTIANDYNHSQREKYATYVQNALTVAKGKAISDPSKPGKAGLYGWRTVGSTHPGGDFVKYKDFAGQTFYTLK